MAKSLIFQIKCDKSKVDRMSIVRNKFVTNNIIIADPDNKHNTVLHVHNCKH
jgi:hypothetical protein